MGLQKVSWSSVKIMKMLEMVKLKPEVWQVEHKLYHDRQAKAAAFQEMGSQLDVSGAEVKRKLHNLRCTYRRLVRHPTQKKNAKGNPELIRWKFYAPIQFLYVNTRYAGNRASQPAVKTELIISDDEDTNMPDNEITETYELDPFSIESSQNLPSPTNSPASLRASSSLSIVDSSLTAAPQHANIPCITNCTSFARNRTEYDDSKRSNRDEFDIFGEYIACKLRNMPDYVRLSAEQKITKVIFKSMKSTVNRKRNSTS